MKQESLEETTSFIGGEMHLLYLFKLGLWHSAETFR
jgi:hypothetical protein